MTLLYEPKKSSRDTLCPPRNPAIFGKQISIRKEAPPPPCIPPHRNKSHLKETLSKILTEGLFLEFDGRILNHYIEFLRSISSLRSLTLFVFESILADSVAWPSGLRRWFKAPVSSEAWVRIPPLPWSSFCGDCDNK